MADKKNISKLPPLEKPITKDDILKRLKLVQMSAEQSFDAQDEAGKQIINRIISVVAIFEDQLQLNNWLPSENQFKAIDKNLSDIEFPYTVLDRAIKISDYPNIPLAIDNLEFILNERKSFQAYFSQALREFDQNLINKIETTSHELDSQVEKAKQVNELLQSQFEKTSSDLQASSRTELSKFQEDNLKIKSDYEAVVKEKLEELNKFVTEAEELKLYIGGKALSGFFAERATQEKKSALYWTIGTWFFAISTLIVIVIIFYLQLNNLIQLKENDYSFLGIKVLLTATLGLIAKWTSKRANRHLADESKYHRLAINMKTIDSFIDKLKPESKEEILKAVALKTFTEVNSNETATDFETPGASDFIKGILPKADK